MMSSAAPSGAALKARMAGLRINTNIPSGSFLAPSSNSSGSHQTPSSKDSGSRQGDMFAQLATAPASKQSFGIGSENHKPAMSKTSEALTSTNWRENCRPQEGLSAHPPTAPVKKVEFSKDEIKKPQKLRIDTTKANNYGLRRYRDTPIDPDFIHSAPATKQEFITARDFSDEDESDDDLFYPPSPRDRSETNPKTFVQLQSFSHFLKERGGTFVGTTSQDNSPPMSSMSPYVTVSPFYEPQGSDNLFPLAEIRAMKHGKRFQTKPWDELDRGVKQGLEGLEPPRSAGIPAELLRQQQQKEVDAQEQRKKTEESIRFQALVAKLQQSAAARNNGRPAPNVDRKPSLQTKDLVQVQLLQEVDQKGPGQHRPSHDSAISGILIEGENQGEKKPSPLNPEASEFCCSFLKKYSSTEQNTPSAEDIRALCQRLDKVEAELAKEKMRSAANMQLLGAAGHHGSGGHPIGIDSSQTARLLGSQFNENQFNGSMFQTAPQSGPPNQFHGSSLPVMPPPGPRGQFHEIQMQQQPIQPTMLPIQHGVQGVYGAGMAPAHMFPLSPPQQQQMPVGPSAQMLYPPTGPRGAKRFNGQAYPKGPAANFPGSIYPTPLGPKPVRKPKGPPREGDLRQTKRQQEYEAYLEWKRATDLEYAQACRARQNKRAERQRSSDA